MIYLSNAFSLNMLAEDDDIAPITVRSISVDDVRNILTFNDVNMAVGHEATAALFQNVLGMSVSCERKTIKLNAGDSLIVGQYIGPRLPEGATELPEGAIISWKHITKE